MLVFVFAFHFFGTVGIASSHFGFLGPVLYQEDTAFLLPVDLLNALLNASSPIVLRAVFP